MAKSPEELAHGALSQQEREEADRNHAQREQMPEGAFLEPGARKYPVKELRAGEWVYSPRLLLAAAREARMHHEEELAERADAIRKRLEGADDAALAFDRSVRSIDQDGRLHVALTPISKAQVSGYYGSEIPGAEALGLDATRLYHLLRDPDELAKAAATANNIPLMAKHIRQSPDDPQQNDVVGSTGTDAVFQAPYLKNSLSVWVRRAIDGIENGKQRELSCSYYYYPDMTPGVYEGQPYDGVMRNIRFNHVALVEDGRAGSDVLVEDSLPPGMKEQTMKASRRAMVAQGALAAWLTPKLANDAKLPDLKQVVLGTTRENWSNAKSTIAERVTAAMKGRLAKDADLTDMPMMLNRLDEEGKDDGPDEMEIMDRKARDADPEMMERVFQFLDGKIDAKLMEGLRQLMGEDRSARDSETEEAMRARHLRELSDCRARDKSARDRRAHDETPEEKERREKEEKERREKEEKERREAEDRRRASDNKAAMDAAIDTALKGERQRQADIREAEKLVRPYIGELAMAQDSADAVYRLALESLGVDLNGIHPSAFKALLSRMPKPGAQPVRMAADSAHAGAFAQRFPLAAAVRRI